MGFFDKLRQGLSKSKFSFSSKKLDENLMEELEEKLILSDIGFDTTEDIMKDLRKDVKEEKITEVDEVKAKLKEKIEESFADLDTQLHIDTKPSIILMVGVNGAGKTTSIGKIANGLKSQGKKVLLVAGDTFRAGAVEQLEEWAKRVDTPIVKGNLNQDPASVIFESIKTAKEENYDVVICDTAGRLQNKVSLMNELEKMNKIIDRELPDADKETLLVIDGTTGKNAISQLKSFNEVTPITGIVITKLDGTSKGGIVIRLAKEFNTPIKYVGVGEGIEDLQEFNAKEFADAIVD